MSYFVHVETFLLLRISNSFQCLPVYDVRAVVKQPINMIIIIITCRLLRTVIIENSYTN
jgi:hypothetical protein